MKGTVAKNESSVSMYLSRYEFPFSDGGFQFLFSVNLPVWRGWPFGAISGPDVEKISVNSSFEL